MAAVAPSRSRAGTLALRGATFAALALAALDLSLPGVKAARAPLLVLDVSDSVGRADDPGSEGVRVVFADGVRRVARGEDLSSLSRARSRVADALAAAQDVLQDAPGARIRLVTDGRDTEGGAVEQAARAFAAGHPVDVQPPSPVPADVGLLSARVASEAPGGERSIEVRVCSSASGRARLTLGRDGNDVDTKEVALPGLLATTVLLRDGPTAPGSATYEIVLAPLDGTPDDDVGDDRLTLVVAGGTPSIAVIGDGALPEVPGAKVVRGPGVDLEQADAVVLLDAPWRRLGRDTAATIARFAAGGGVVVAVGGPDSFGPGGWSGTSLESLLPLRSRSDARELAILLLVLDASGSMAEAPALGGPTSHAALAEAVSRTLDLLPANASVAGLAFRGAPEDQVLAQGWSRADDAPAREALGAAFRKSEPAGGTNIPAALERAASLLHDRPAARRFAIVATDGDPDHVPDPAAYAHAKAALAGAGVELAALVRGDARAAQALTEVAGDSARVVTVSATGEIPDALERLFTRSMHPEEVVAGPFAPAPVPSATPTFSAPSLTRAHALEAAPDATLHTLASKVGSSPLPLLAERHVGAGRVFALAWGPGLEPASDRKAATDAVARLVGTVARLADRGFAAGGDDAALEVSGPRLAGRLVVRRGERGATSDLFESAPGVYRGHWPAGSGPGDEEPLFAKWGDAWRPLRLPARPPIESLGCGVDAERLQAIASAGGGDVLAPGEEPPASEVRGRVPLAPWLALVAVACLVLDRARASGSRSARR